MHGEFDTTVAALSERDDVHRDGAAPAVGRDPTPKRVGMTNLRQAVPGPQEVAQRDPGTAGPRSSGGGSVSAETTRIRVAVFARAKNRCECGCGRWITNETGRLDHFFGRGKVPQAVGNCWALSIACDERKTLNQPDAAGWLKRFAYHAGRHGLFAERELALAKLAVLIAKGRAA